MSVSNSVLTRDQALERCSEGHPLVQNVASQSGRCQACSRWIFGKEKVMMCNCCNSSYCSACAPQLLSTSDDHLWEDVLSTVGSALRDMERMKTQISSEIEAMNFQSEVNRIRSAFNCQAPGAETLSAEQIVVEHAYEQVKGALNCGAPDTSDLRSQEEVIDHGVVEPAREPAGGICLTGRDAVDKAPAESFSEKPPVIDLSIPAKGQENTAPSGYDLLDMSETPLADEKGEPTDLLDLSDSLQVPDTMPSADGATGADITVNQQANLLDIVDEPPSQAKEPSPAQPVQELADLLDFSEHAVAAAH